MAFEVREADLSQQQQQQQQQQQGAGAKGEQRGENEGGWRAADGGGEAEAASAFRERNSVPSEETPADTTDTRPQAGPSSTGRCIQLNTCSRKSVGAGLVSTVQSHVARQERWGLSCSAKAYTVKTASTSWREL